MSPENSDEIQRFCKEEEIPFVGVIPYDKSASAAINKGCSLAEMDCPAADALKKNIKMKRQYLGLNGKEIL